MKRGFHHSDAEGLNKAEGDRMRKITEEQSRARRNVDIERRAIAIKRGGGLCADCGQPIRADEEFLGGGNIQVRHAHGCPPIEGPS